MKQWPSAMQALIVGIYVPLSLLIPTGIGFLLDRKEGHGFPSYALIGLGIGTVIMIYGVYRIMKPFLDEAKEQTDQKEALPRLVKIMTSKSTKRNKGTGEKP